MPRRKSAQPTDGELEILKILWESAPCELGRICSEMRRVRPVATTTVATMLTVMLGKGLVRRITGPNRYLWSAQISRDAATRGMVARLLDHAFDGSADLLLAHLIESRKLSERTRREVLALLKQGAARDKADVAPGNSTLESESRRSNKPAS